MTVNPKPYEIKMVRKGLYNVYLTEKEADLVDKYIQEHFVELKKDRKANRSAVVRFIVQSWAESHGISERKTT